ncbi:MAG TPA: prepilin-type N-terminal cleavage/methylation domain-containing protein [Propionibacteriaceae bacterium]
MRDDSGFSLTEMVVVVVLLGVVLAAAWTVMSAVSSMSNSLSARATATAESDSFISAAGTELRQAASLKAIAGTDTANADAQAAFYDIGPRQIGFYADIERDGRPERVAYYVSGTSLMRQQADATNGTYPYSWAASSTAQAVVQVIDASWTGPIFLYYTNDDWPPTQITAVSQVASITAVTIQMRNQKAWADQAASYGASDTVRVRAIGNGF